MKRLLAFVLAAALVLSSVSVCFAALVCAHKKCTYKEKWEKKDAPVYCSFCEYNHGPHPHIREFWKVTGTDTCNICAKSWVVEEYTVDIRTYCTSGPH